MKPNRSESAQCADVRPLGNAQSHITPSQRTTPRTVLAQSSLKALAGAVIDRTLPRTLPAHSEKTPRTFPQPTADADEVIRLVKQCGRFYGFSEQEFSEAIAAAIADLDAALTCFRAIATEIKQENRGDDLVNT